MLLNEIRMGLRDLQTTLAQIGSKALIGFEIETYSELPDELLEELDMVKQVYDLKSIDDIFEHFQLSSNGQKRFAKDLKTFWDEQATMWAEDNWTKFVKNKDESEEDQRDYAFDLAVDYFYSKHDTSSMDEYFDEEFGDASNFIEHYYMMPKKGWYRTDVSFYANDGPSFAKIQKAFYDDTFRKLDKITNGGIRSVEEDGSIQPDNTKKYGAEIVTKPLRADIALENLGKIFDWMKREVFETNQSTGLHINVSIDDVKQIDWLKLGLMLGEQYEMFKWKREKNAYTQAQMGNVIDKLKMSHIGLNDIAQGGEKFDKAVAILNQYIDKTKYRTFNVLHMEHEGYVEFRIAGGKDYHDKFDDVLHSALRYLRVLHAASDKNAFRKEYIKKVYTMLVNAGEFEQIEARGGADVLEQQLTTLWKAASGRQDVAFDENVAKDHEKAQDAVARIAALTAMKLIRDNLKPNANVRKILVTAAYKYGVSDEPEIAGHIVGTLVRAQGLTSEQATHLRELTYTLLGL